MNQYRIIYKQKYMGEVIQSAYIKSVSNERELHNAINALYEDPHVFSVEYEKLKSE